MVDKAKNGIFKNGVSEEKAEYMAIDFVLRNREQNQNNLQDEDIDVLSYRKSVIEHKEWFANLFKKNKEER